MGFARGSLHRDGVHQRVTPLVSLFLLCKQESDLANRSKQAQRPSNSSLSAARHPRQDLRETEPGTLQVQLWEGKDIASWKVEFRNFLCLPLSSIAIESPLRFTPRNKLGWPFGLGIRKKLQTLIETFKDQGITHIPQRRDSRNLTATYHNQSGLSMETHLERSRELRKDRHVYRKLGLGWLSHSDGVAPVTTRTSDPYNIGQRT